MTKEKKLWIEYVPLKKLEKWTRNPKKHDNKGINQSVDRFGFTDPITIDERTGKMVAGHGRIEELEKKYKSGENPPPNIIVSGKDWSVPVVRGNHFENDKEVEAYLLTCNQLVMSGGWDNELLEAMLPNVDPIGFDEIMAQMEADIDRAIEETPQLPGLIPSRQPGIGGVGEVKVTAEGVKREEVGQKKGESPDFEQIPGNLQGVFDLAEDVIFSSTNDLGIPDLLPEMILPEIPQPIKTWGGKKETPDDGESHYLYVFGSTPSEGVPYNRALLAWWCHDGHIKTLLETPAYRVGKMINAGVLGAVVPDVSLWQGNPKAIHIFHMYQAQWMGRFIQEAGVKIVPRFEYFLPEVRDFSLLGIPKNSPTLATQLHTGFEDEHIPLIKESLITGLKLIEPGQFLVYVSERGANIIDDVRSELAVQEIIMLPTAKKVRRTESRAETDPYLRKLRERKRGWEGKQNAEETDSP